MQKVYLLLRSNKQTGPYTLEELLQLNLKPFDLVWVNGRSAAWQYPSEIPALKPYVPETPQAEAPFQPIATAALEEKMTEAISVNLVSQPQNPIPQRTETPRRVFVSVPKTYAAKEQTTYASGQQSNRFTPEHKPFIPEAKEHLYPQQEEKSPVSSYNHPSQSNPKQKPVEHDVHTNYARSLNEVEEDYTNWVYRQKTKKKPAVNTKDLALAVVLLAVIVGGYYVMSKPSIANSVLPSNKGTTVVNPQSIKNESQETEPKEILPPELQPKSTATGNSIQNIEAKKQKNIKTKNPLTVSKAQTNSSVPEVPASIPTGKTNSNIHKTDVGSAERESTQPTKQNVPVQKKKKLGEVLKDFFAKKDKKEEPKNDQPVMEDPKPATNRQATRREADERSSNENTSPDETSTANLMEKIDLYSNASGNWMMGVKNLKITLRNRNNVAIQAASVTVNYYDENDGLLEKKLVYFSNVAPGSKATVAAPDQKFADHVDFKLTTVTAKEDRYARY